MDSKELFDDVAKRYDHLLRENLGAYGKDIAYYAEYKVKLTTRMVRNRYPRRILEFGCGTGRNSRHLIHYFPEADITGCDISEESIEQAKRNNPGPRYATFDEVRGAGKPFDLIFVACVFHHIMPRHRDTALSQLHALLTPAGEMIFFEHNPYNPLTMRAVTTCPFDKGAILLKPDELIRRAAKLNFRLQKRRFCLFFPSVLKIFSPFEIFLSRIPLGGQYVVCLAKI